MSLLNNRYLILSELGKGGFGHTFLAEDTHLPSRRRCVIKQFKPANNDPNLLPHLQERFWREASILERVGEEHSQIPRLYAYFVEDGQFYLVQELVDGQTLSQKVRTEGLLKSEVVREIVSSLLEILEYLHAADIIHRDIKPDNIIYRKRDGKPILIDFGTVKETVTTVYDQGGVPTSLIIGSPGYMPIEQAAGLAVYSSDLYALGWTAIYLLTSKQPSELVDRRTGENHWREFAPGVEEGLAVVIDKAVQRISSNRYETAGEMRQALNPVLPKTMLLALPAPAQPKQVTPQSVRRSGNPHMIYAGAGLIAVLIIVIGIVVLLKLVADDNSSLNSTTKPIYTVSSQPQASNKNQETKVLTVDAQAMWTHSNILVNKGDIITVTASGQVNGDIAQGYPAYKWVGPDGWGQQSPYIKPGSKMMWVLGRDSSYMCLTGRIGNGQPFKVGSHFSFTSNSSGYLFFGVNDELLDENGNTINDTTTSGTWRNNGGAFTVRGCKRFCVSGC